MASARLKKVWEEVQALRPEEQWELRARLDTVLVPPASPLSEDEFEQMLLAKGILSEIKPPLTDFATYQQRRMVETTGKLLSEVIIEERR